MKVQVLFAATKTRLLDGFFYWLPVLKVLCTPFHGRIHACAWVLPAVPGQVPESSTMCLRTSTLNDSVLPKTAFPWIDLFFIIYRLHSFILWGKPSIGQCEVPGLSFLPVSFSE